jgi:hypothetical protein
MMEEPFFMTDQFTTRKFSESAVVMERPDFTHKDFSEAPTNLKRGNQWR